MTPPHAHGGPGPPDEPYTAALERMNRFQEPEGRTAIGDLRLPTQSRGLDVGCGVGLWALWLAEAVGSGGSVLGIEPSAERVEAARALGGAALPPPRLEFRQGDGTAIESPDRAFDWVWCGDVLHHVQQTQVALKEMIRVTRPGGRLVVKESQVLPAVFLPGHPELERRVQQAETARSREEAGERSFQERRQRTAESMREAGLTGVAMRTYLIERRAPLAAPARAYIERTVFGRNWGARLRDFLDAADQERLRELCDPASPRAILDAPDYYCLYSITVFTAVTPA